MAHFANFTGKLSHGVARWRPTSSTSPGRPTRSGHAQPGVRDGTFRPQPRRGIRGRRQRRRGRVLHRAVEQHLGHHLDIVDRTGSLNKAQSTPNDDGSYTCGSPPPTRAWRTGSTPTDFEGILTLRMAEFGGDGPAPTWARGAGGRTRRARTSGPGSAPGVGVRTCGRVGWPARRLSAPAAGGDELTWRAGSSPDAPPGSAAKSPAPHSEAGHSVAVTARNIGSVADFADRFGDRALVLP